jgi:tRNA modification GTPase
MVRAALNDTIVATATPPGRGGIGIVRVSGPAVRELARQLIGAVPVARHAHYTAFRGPGGELLDRGIALFFPAPGSYTGDDVLELQGHGSEAVLQTIVQCLLDMGARHARPGEFTERAYLNDKLDLLQAEAVADLIDSQSQAAARGALRSLEGEFSRSVLDLQARLTDVRVQLESLLDFPEEEIDGPAREPIARDLQDLQQDLDQLLQQARQGQLLREGLTVVITGDPNVGKSSLINRLTGEDIAIVTEIPGTTRDTLHAQCIINGLTLRLVDTAGLRESDDRVEQEGVRRARAALRKADLVLWLHDEAGRQTLAEARQHVPTGVGLIAIRNKIDISGQEPYRRPRDDGTVEIGLSALTGDGIDRLLAELQQASGFTPVGESQFIARERHLRALEQACANLMQAGKQLFEGATLELPAEDLRRAQQNLGELTGEFCADDLLGEIFARFCIGK